MENETGFLPCHHWGEALDEEGISLGRPAESVEGSAQGMMGGDCKPPGCRTGSGMMQDLQRMIRPRRKFLVWRSRLGFEEVWTFLGPPPMSPN